MNNQSRNNVWGAYYKPGTKLMSNLTFCNMHLQHTTMIWGMGGGGGKGWGRCMLKKWLRRKVHSYILNKRTRSLTSVYYIGIYRCLTWLSVWLVSWCFESSQPQSPCKACCDVVLLSGKSTAVWPAGRFCVLQPPHLLLQCTSGWWRHVVPKTHSVEKKNITKG